MGLSRVSGPFYGSKATLASMAIATVSSAASAVVVFQTVIPVYEDWFATEWILARGSTGSTGFGAALIDDSTVVSSATLNSSVANASTLVTLTADGGEYEGVRMAAGSTITFSVSSPSSQSASSAISLTLRGFTRFVSSTRSEGP